MEKLRRNTEKVFAHKFAKKESQPHNITGRDSFYFSLIINQIQNILLRYCKKFL